MVRGLWLVVVVVALIGGGVLLAPLLDTTVFPDAPESFVTFEDGPASFRHPPGWRATRDGADVTVRPPASGRSSWVIVLRRFGIDDQRTRRAIARGERRMRRGKRPFEHGRYELDLPGHGDVEVDDAVIRLSPKRFERVQSLVRPYGEAGLVSFAVRGPVSDDPREDPRVIMGTFRLDR